MKLRLFWFKKKKSQWRRQNKEVIVAKMVITITVITINYLAARSKQKSLELWEQGHFASKSQPNQQYNCDLWLCLNLFLLYLWLLKWLKFKGLKKKKSFVYVLNECMCEDSNDGAFVLWCKKQQQNRYKNGCYWIFIYIGSFNVMTPSL